MADIKGYIVATVKFSQEDGQWTALCVELGTAACGDTFEEAVEAIKDLMFLHLNTLEEIGTRKAFLKKHKIKLHRQKPKAATRNVPVRSGEIVGRIPIPVAA